MSQDNTQTHAIICRCNSIVEFTGSYEECVSELHHKREAYEQCSVIEIKQVK